MTAASRKARASASFIVTDSGAPSPEWLGFLVPGVPKPKGSMRHVGGGRLVEQVGNRPWRDAVTWHAANTRAGRDPFIGPVAVVVRLTVPRPKSAPKTRRTWPVTRSSGDVDKHLRLILDALVDAGVLADDAQVVDARISKDYAESITGPGAWVEVAAVDGAS